jgi:hypothetical protein
MPWDALATGALPLLLFLVGITCGYVQGYKDGRTSPNPSGRSSGS